MLREMEREVRRRGVTWRAIEQDRAMREGRGGKKTRETKERNRIK